MRTPVALPPFLKQERRMFSFSKPDNVEIVFITVGALGLTLLFGTIAYGLVAL
jgi:hypothetical protein